MQPTMKIYADEAINAPQSKLQCAMHNIANAQPSALSQKQGEAKRNAKVQLSAWRKPKRLEI